MRTLQDVPRLLPGEITPFQKHVFMWSCQLIHSVMANTQKEEVPMALAVLNILNALALHAPLLHLLESQLA